MGNLHEMFAYSVSNAVKGKQPKKKKVVEKINLQKVLEDLVYAQK